MNRKETYEAWKNRRKDVDLDAGFVDRVMQQVLASQKPQPSDARSVDRFHRVNGHRTWGILTTSALLLISLTVGLLRYGSIIALIFLMNSTGY